MRRTFARIPAAVLALTVACATAFEARAQGAGALATARLSNFTLSLTDLDPGDGIAARYSFIDNPPSPERSKVSVDSGVRIRPDSNFKLATVRKLGEFLDTRATALASVPGASVTSLVGKSSLSANGLAVVEGGEFFSQVASDTAAGPEDRFGILLSPHTALTFMALSRVNVSVFDACSTRFDFCAGATGSAFLAGAFKDPTTGREFGHTTVGAGRSVGTGDSTLALLHESVERELGITLSNTSDRFLAVNLHADVVVTGVSAVPEPHTWALMLMGLAVIGAAARRWRRQ